MHAFCGKMPWRYRRCSVGTVRHHSCAAASPVERAISVRDDVHAPRIPPVESEQPTGRTLWPAPVRRRRPGCKVPRCTPEISGMGSSFVVPGSAEMHATARYLKQIILKVIKGTQAVF